MTPSHTPGPWTVEPIEGYGYLIKEWNGSATEDSANKRLIAAAPDLLAACKSVMRYIEKCPACDGSGEPQRGDSQDRCERCCGVGRVVTEPLACEIHLVEAAISKATSL